MISDRCASPAGRASRALKLAPEAGSIYSGPLSGQPHPAREAHMSSLRSRQTFRLGPAVEWLLAASFLACCLALAVLIVREVRAAPVPPLSAPVARLLPTSIPSAVPSRAVSVPMLPFRDGKELKVGDSVEAVATTLGRAA